jgi:hypothetical protein
MSLLLCIELSNLEATRLDLAVHNSANALDLSH